MGRPWRIALILGTVFAAGAGVFFALDGRLLTDEYLFVLCVAYALPLVRTAALEGARRNRNRR